VRIRQACVLLAVLLFSGMPYARAQQIQVNRENRTVAVSATATAEADAEVAMVEIGYHDYGRTHGQAYEDNFRASDKILKALESAGVPKASIITESIALSRVDSEDENWTAAERAERQFEATQRWKIRLRAMDAQKIVDLAVSAGANLVTNVDWQVEDPKALEAEADAAALAKAKALAQGMAARLGAKLGELMYASNQMPISRFSPVLETTAVTVSARAAPPPHLELLPQKVSQSATVYAVFALQ
jgi:uncharacterized protein YggE